jgi:hypothetical protein
LKSPRLLYRGARILEQREFPTGLWRFKPTGNSYFALKDDPDRKKVFNSQNELAFSVPPCTSFKISCHYYLAAVYILFVFIF